MLQKSIWFRRKGRRKFKGPGWMDVALQTQWSKQLASWINASVARSKRMSISFMMTLLKFDCSGVLLRSDFCRCHSPPPGLAQLQRWEARSAGRCVYPIVSCGCPSAGSRDGTRTCLREQHPCCADSADGALPARTWGHHFHHCTAIHFNLVSVSTTQPSFTCW